MSHDKLFVQLALQKKFLDKGQVQRVRRLLTRHPNITMPQACVRLGLLSLAQVTKILKAIAAHQAAVRRIDQPTSVNSLEHSIGSYTLLEEIGRGSMGVVFKARQKTTKRIVALKIMRTFEEEEPDPILVKRFRREIMITSQLEHPNIVRVYDADNSDGTLYYAMQYIAGQNLTQLGRQDYVTAMELVSTICKAMAYVHSQHIIHRDLKLSNILVDQQGRPYINDFGLAKDISSYSRITRAQEIVGTAHFIAPEIITGSTKGNAQTDIYAIGVILYRLVTAVYPFEETSYSRLCMQIVEQAPIRPSQNDPHIPRTLEKIILKAIHKKVSRRYRTCQQMAADLDKLLGRNLNLSAARSGIESLAGGQITPQEMRLKMALAFASGAIMVLVIILLVLLLR